MRAYSVTRPEDQDRTNGVVVVIPSKLELLRENERLRKRWAEAVDQRIAYQVRLSKALRVLASLGRLSPRMAALIRVARREVYGRLP